MLAGHTQPRNGRLRRFSTLRAACCYNRFVIWRSMILALPDTEMSPAFPGETLNKIHPRYLTAKCFNIATHTAITRNSTFSS
jgi:hypothetical protein